MSPNQEFSNLQNLAKEEIVVENLINSEAERAKKLFLELGGVLFDYQKTDMSLSALDGLTKYSKSAKLLEKRDAMFSGNAINFTENRAVMHFALRNPKRAWSAKDKSLGQSIENAQEIASSFAQKIFDGSIKANNGNKFSAILHIGIGGSDLGPRLVYESLRPLHHSGPDIRFCANIEPTEFEYAIRGLDASTTLIVCVSKTFTTIETLTNLKLARDWIRNSIGENDANHLVAISAAPDKAIAHGISEDRVFGFEEWVGGRFSLWSSVGLSLEMAFGRDLIARLRKGARIMDEHFETAPIEENIPIIGGLNAVWNSVFKKYQSRAIIPYSTRLKLLPQFLQQLDMESNGKAVGANNEDIIISGPVVWGAEGTNAQHAFFQHLHQSPIVTPLEFILILDDGLQHKDSLRLTLANALAQSEALMRGKTLEAVKEEMKAVGKSAAEIEKIAPHRVFKGNRPSINIVLRDLSPENLGILLSYYEHRCFVEGVLYGVNSFDQWGVELGKVIALEINEDLKNGASPKRDKATAKLIEFFR